jgi:MoaA/NifB/PqqE/SkfB family radical SAM enzyme
LGTVKISISGGEPLMRDDIGEIVNYIKSKGILLNLISNGSLVKKRINDIKNVDVFLVSYDGPPDAQEDVRGKKAHDIALDAIKTAKENNLNIMTLTTLTKNNLNELDSILETADEVGFSCLFQPAYHYPMSGDFVKELFPEPQDFRKTIEKLEKIKKSPKGHLICNSMVSLGYLKEWPRFKKVSCWAGRAYTYIDTDGQIYPCGLLIRKVKGVSLLETTVAEALKKFQEISCPGCWCTSNVDYNYLFSFNLPTWVHYLTMAASVRK